MKPPFLCFLPFLRQKGPQEAFLIPAVVLRRGREYVLRQIALNSTNAAHPIRGEPPFRRRNSK